MSRRSKRRSLGVLIDAGTEAVDQRLDISSTSDSDVCELPLWDFLLTTTDVVGDEGADAFSREVCSDGIITGGSLGSEVEDIASCEGAKSHSR